MRTMYAIVSAAQAAARGVDLSTHRLLEDGAKVVLTQQEAAGMPDAELMTRNQVLLRIHNPKTQVDKLTS